MKIHNLNDFHRGWIVGDFDPNLLRKTDIEIAVQKYKAGEYEKLHKHNKVTEISVIIYGKVMMGNREYGADDIIELPPGSVTNFTALVDSAVLVIKYPSIPSDKIILEK